MYNLVDAQENNIELLKDIKLETVLASRDEFDEITDEQLREYVDYSVKEFLNNYKLIIIEGCIAGVFLVRDYEDGVLIDEIYLYDEFRNNGIGTDIIKNILCNNIYLWVYKNNTKAIRLYEKLNFKVVEESKTRLKMKKESLN